MSWAVEGAKERHWEGVHVNCYKGGIRGSEDGGPDDQQQGWMKTLYEPGDPGRF